MLKLPILLLFLIHHSSSILPSKPTKSYDSELRCFGSSINCPTSSVIVPRQATLITISNSEDLICSEEDVKGEINESAVICAVNVTSYVESSCFGNYECKLEGSSMPKEDEKCTNNNVFKYINISYDCIEIDETWCLECDKNHKALVSKSSGYLSSRVAADYRTKQNNCGTSKCPWLLKTNPGQNINIWFLHTHSTNNERSKTMDNGCGSVVFSVNERSIEKVTEVCPAEKRISRVYTSVSNEVVMYFNEENLKNIGDQYLVYYEVIGCADFIPPKFSRMQRTMNHVEVDCPETPKLKWTMDCINNQWVGAEDIKECPPIPGFLDAQKDAMSSKRASIFDSNLLNLPMGVMLTIVVASAVVLGIFILTIGVVCLKRHNYDIKHKDDPNVYGAACSEFEFKEMGGGLMNAQKFAYQQHLLTQADKQRRASGDLLARDNTYAMQDLVKMDTRPLPSIPNNASPSTTYKRQCGPVPYGVYPQARVAVQFHRADSDVMAGGYPCNQYHPRGYMTSRPGTNQIRYPRMPQQATMGRNDDNHLYFVLDGSAPEEKVGTLPPPPNNMLSNSCMQPPSTFPQSTNFSPPTTMPPPAHNKPNLKAGAPI